MVFFAVLAAAAGMKSGAIKENCFYTLFLKYMLVCVERLYCKRPIQCLALASSNTPSPPGKCVGAGGGHTRWVERGVGVNILEDARHSSVLYMCKYFVLVCYDFCKIMDHSCSDFDFFKKMENVKAGTEANYWKGRHILLILNSGRL